MESLDNPYQAPASELLSAPAKGPTSGQDATRTARLLAALVDMAVVLAIVVPVQWLSGVNIMRAQPWPDTLLWTLFAVVITLLINGRLLATRAQTVGKKLMGIEVVTLDGARASFWRIFVWRMLVVDVLTMIPGVGQGFALVDCLLIFGKERRCLHDYLGKTRVVRV